MVQLFACKYNQEVSKKLVGICLRPPEKKEKRRPKKMTIVGRILVGVIIVGRILVGVIIVGRILGRVANRPGMAGTVPELTSFVPCPGLGYFCPGSY